MVMKMTKGVTPKGTLKMKKGVTVPRAPFKRRKRYFSGVPNRSKKA